MFERLGLELESWVHRLEGDDISVARKAFPFTVPSIS